MKKIENNHTFAICAYKESKYLEECVKSIKNQTIKSNIIMATSTPNDYIKGLSLKYNIPLYINEGEKGIGQDWNFAVSKTKTDYVTVIHQDDIYNSDYLKNIADYINKGKDFVIAFTKYNEIKNGKIIKLNKNLKIKEFLLFPLKLFNKSKFSKKFALAFGNSICCPSVTLNTRIVGKKPYISKMKCNLDWETWYEMSKIKGRFLYIPKYLMCHRIHEESETTNLISNNVRSEEDYSMFKKFWPDFMAKFLSNKYKESLKSNNI